jgi:glycosidase
MLLSWLLLVCVVVPLSARTHRKKRKPMKQGKPAVQEISPPNWWSGFPDPMLLVQGKNLLGAHVATSVPGISVRRTRISANGHWAWVWLDISAAPPQHFNLLVRTLNGQVAIPYELDKRHEPTDGFQGFTSADVLYWIAPESFSRGNLQDENLVEARRKSGRNKENAYRGGDLRGIENHLDYLQQLGITTVEIAPLYSQDQLPQSGVRQDTIDMYRVDPHFGTLEDYEALAQALHSRGMKLVLETAPNQVGPSSPWVLDPPAPDWFHGTPAHHLAATEDFGAATDPHAAPAAYRAVVDGWIADTLPDLNQSNPLVREYLIQNAVWWIESGTLDGIRLDAFPHVDRAFWQDLHRELKALYPRLTAFGEISSPDPTVVAYFAGGVKRGGIDTGLYTPSDFPGYFALQAALTGADAPMTKLTDVQRQDWLYPHPERLLTFFDSADTTRFLSVSGATDAHVKLAFGLLATMRGMPQIYFGDEIAMSGANDPGHPGLFPGGFPGDTNDAFNAAGRTPQQEAMHAWVQGLLNLRAHHAVLQAGAQQDLLVDQTGFVFARVEAPPAGRAVPLVSRGEIILVLLNKSDQPRTFHLDFSHTSLQGVRTLVPEWNTKIQEPVLHNNCDVEVGSEQLVIFQAERQESQISEPVSSPQIH